MSAVIEFQKYKAGLTPLEIREAEAYFAMTPEQREADLVKFRADQEALFAREGKNTPAVIHDTKTGVVYKAGSHLEAEALAERLEAAAAKPGPAKPAEPDPFETAYPFAVIEAESFAGGEYVEPEWQVFELVPKQGTGLNTGASQTFKSFAALELATCINRGTPYHGRQVTKGRAVIVVAEGTYGYPVRMKGLAKHLQCDMCELPAVIPAAPNLFHREEVDVLIRELKKRGATYVVIDTKWRCSVGAEENSAKDSAVVFGAMERISRELGCFVTAISHTGLQDGTRIRGSSSQFAAVDVEVLHERNGDAVTLTVTKLKDGQDGAVITMKQRYVELGVSPKTGKSYGSLVLEHTDVAPVKAKTQPKHGTKNDAALKAVKALIAAKHGAAVEFEDARVAVVATLAPPAPNQRDRRSSRAGEFLTELVNLGHLFRSGDMLRDSEGQTITGEWE